MLTSDSLIPAAVVPRHACHQLLWVALLGLCEELGGSRAAQHGRCPTLVSDDDLVAANEELEIRRGAHGASVAFIRFRVPTD